MIIGLSGWARSGKDTVGAHLVEEYGFERQFFAQGVYDAAMALDPIIFTGRVERLSSVVARLGWDEAKKFEEVRRTLQRIGTEVGREVIDSDVWIQALSNRLRWDSLHLRVRGDYVITDVRFMNEAHWIQANGGQVWRIRRTGVGPANDHPSENELNDYPFNKIIQNDDSIEHLHGVIDAVYAALTTPRL